MLGGHHQKYVKGERGSNQGPILTVSSSAFFFTNENPQVMLYFKCSRGLLVMPWSLIMEEEKKVFHFFS